MATTADTTASRPAGRSSTNSSPPTGAVTPHRTAGVEPQVNRLAVLGHPVSHSRSPAMQTAALEALGLAGEWSYEAIDVDPSEFEARTRALPGQGYVGANVTIPHKEAALAVTDQASPSAQEIGAANTLSFAGNAIHAENTDASGLVAAIPEPVDGKTALV